MPIKITAEVGDLIDLYDTLKASHTTHISVKQNRLQQLLTACDLEDKESSQLSTHMKQLAGPYHTYNCFFQISVTSTRSYRAFGRELLAIYLTINYFTFLLQRREFATPTDHKPLCNSFNTSYKQH